MSNLWFEMLPHIEKWNEKYWEQLNADRGFNSDNKATKLRGLFNRRLNNNIYLVLIQYIFIHRCRAPAYEVGRYFRFSFLNNLLLLVGLCLYVCVNSVGMTLLRMPIIISAPCSWPSAQPLVFFFYTNFVCCAHCICVFQLNRRWMIMHSYSFRFCDFHLCYKFDLIWIPHLVFDDRRLRRLMVCQSIAYMARAKIIIIIIIFVITQFPVSNWDSLFVRIHSNAGIIIIIIRRSVCFERVYCASAYIIFVLDTFVSHFRVMANWPSHSGKLIWSVRIIIWPDAWLRQCWRCSCIHHPRGTLCTVRCPHSAL